MSVAVNRQIRLARRPEGLPGDDVWTFTEEPVPSPGPGELVVRNLYLSVDPAMRSWISGASAYAQVGIGDVMRAPAVGRVVASQNEQFAVGDHVAGSLHAEDYSVTDGTGLLRIDPDIAPLPVYLGTLGFTGITAYFGVCEVAKPQPGEYFVVSGAAGATGMVAGQLAKNAGAHVVGIAGGPSKCAFLVDELGFDAAIDYRNEDVAESLRKHCPDGVNVFFDNVGGDVLDAVLTRLAFEGRVVICGAISQYNNDGPPKGPKNYMSLLLPHASMRGFFVGNFKPRWQEAMEALAQLLTDGKLVTREEIDEGLEGFPQSLRKLYTGGNTGKLVVHIADD